MWPISPIKLEAKANEANGAILTNKANEAIKVNEVIEANNISLTKYYSLSELYVGIWGCNNQLGTNKTAELEKLDEANKAHVVDIEAGEFSELALANKAV